MGEGLRRGNRVGDGMWAEVRAGEGQKGEWISVGTTLKLAGNLGRERPPGIYGGDPS